MNAQRELNVTWDVELYGELLKIGGGKERYLLLQKYFAIILVFVYVVLICCAF